MKVLMKYMVPIVCLVIVIISGMVALSIQGERSSVLASKRAELVKAQNDKDVLSMAVQNAQDKVSTSVSTVADDRKIADDNLVKGLFKLTFTWDSYAQYMANRNLISKTYGLDANSTYMKTLMPAVYDRQDASGKHFNQIDTNGYSMTYSSMSSTVTRVFGGDYEYFTTIKTKMNSADGGSYQISNYAMTYRVTANHKITNVTLYPVSGDMMSSDD